MNTAEFLAMTVIKHFPWKSFRTYVFASHSIVRLKKIKYIDVEVMKDTIFDMCNDLIFGTSSTVTRMDFSLSKVAHEFIFAFKHQNASAKLTVDKNDFTAVTIESSFLSDNKVSDSLPYPIIPDINKGNNDGTKKNHTVKKKEKFIYRIRSVKTGKYVSRNAKATWQQRGAVIEAAKKIARHEGLLEICIFPINDPIAIPLTEFIVAYDKEMKEANLSKKQREINKKRQELLKEIDCKAEELEKLRKRLNNID